MITRLILFNTMPLLLCFTAVFGCMALRVRPKKDPWDSISRITSSLGLVSMGTLPLFMSIKNHWDSISRITWSLCWASVGALPLFKSIIGGPVILAEGRERTFSLIFSAACLVVVLVALWVNLRAPRIDREEFKRDKRRRLRGLVIYVCGVAVILAVGGAAWLHGRSAGLRALHSAVVEARAIVASRPGGSSEAAGAYVEFFRALNADGELQKAFDDHRWPEGEKLRALVDARRALVSRAESLAKGAPPAFEEKLDNLGMIEPQPAWEVFPGFRAVWRLLELATHEAAARGDTERALALCETCLRLAGHAAQPGDLIAYLTSVAICTPELETLGLVLSSVVADERGALAAYAADLSGWRRAAPANLARATLEGAAAWILWLESMANPQSNAGDEERQMAHGLGRIVLPYYGQDFVPGVLQNARLAGEVAQLPLEEARIEAKRLDAMIPRPPCMANPITRHLPSDGAPCERTVAMRTRHEQALGGKEIACALRLYALDHGGAYPGRLGELSPQYIDASVVNLNKPEDIGYERTASGCRLCWNVRICSSLASVEIVIGKEIVIGQ